MFLRTPPMILVAVLLGLLPAPLFAQKYSYFTIVNARGAFDEQTYGITGGTLVCEGENLRPIAIFGACKPIGKPSEYIYLIVITQGKTQNLGGISSGGSGKSSSTKGVEGEWNLSWGTRKIDIAFKFPVDLATRALTQTTLKIGGVNVVPDGPRIFVADLTGEKVAYHPLKIALPKVAPDVGAESSDDYGRIVVESIADLTQESEELRKLLAE